LSKIAYKQFIVVELQSTFRKKRYCSGINFHFYSHYGQETQVQQTPISKSTDNKSAAY